MFSGVVGIASGDVLEVIADTTMPFVGCPMTIKWPLTEEFLQVRGDFMRLQHFQVLIG